MLDYTRFFLGYRLENVNLEDFDESYPETGSLRMVNWPLIKSTASLSLVRNSTDSPFHPTRGSVITWNTEIAGGLFGGNVQFIRNSASISWFKLLFWKFTFHLGVDVASIQGGQIPIDPVAAAVEQAKAFFGELLVAEMIGHRCPGL